MNLIKVRRTAENFSAAEYFLMLELFRKFSVYCIEVQIMEVTAWCISALSSIADLTIRFTQAEAANHPLTAVRPSS